MKPRSLLRSMKLANKRQSVRRPNVALVRAQMRRYWEELKMQDIGALASRTGVSWPDHSAPPLGSVSSPELSTILVCRILPRALVLSRVKHWKNPPETNSKWVALLNILAPLISGKLRHLFVPQETMQAQASFCPHVLIILVHKGAHLRRQLAAANPRLYSDVAPVTTSIVA